MLRLDEVNVAICAGSVKEACATSGTVTLLSRWNNVWAQTAQISSMEGKKSFLYPQ